MSVFWINFHHLTCSPFFFFLKNLDAFSLIYFNALNSEFLFHPRRKYRKCKVSESSKHRRKLHWFSPRKWFSKVLSFSLFQRARGIREFDKKCYKPKILASKCFPYFNVPRRLLRYEEITSATEMPYVIYVLISPISFAFYRCIFNIIDAIRQNSRRCETESREIDRSIKVKKYHRVLTLFPFPRMFGGAQKCQKTQEIIQILFPLSPVFRYAFVSSRDPASLKMYGQQLIII